MSDIERAKQCPSAIWARGKLRIKDSVEPVRGRVYVYQRVKPGLGNVACAVDRDLQLRLEPSKLDPQTPSQLAQRQRLAVAVAAWQSLDDAEREAWGVRGRGQHLPGYHSFLSAMMR